MNIAQRLRALAKRTALDSIGEELVAIAQELESSKALSWLAACRTLERLGYTYHGAELWKPPLGNPAAQPGAQNDPLPMVLHCPKCGMQHIDAPDPMQETEGWAGAWTNPPHRSHLCHGCGTVWRPADVPTTGVRSISTKGKTDTWVPGQPTQQAAGEPVGEPKV